jgi:hypothetical protein
MFEKRGEQLTFLSFPHMKHWVLLLFDVNGWASDLEFLSDRLEEVDDIICWCPGTRSL